MTAKKILVVRLSSIGDIILCSPFLRNLREAYPDSQIHMLVKEQFAELVSDNPHINQIIPLKSKQSVWNIAKKLKKNGYDLILDIHNNLRSNIIRRCIGAKETVQFQRPHTKRNLLIHTGMNLYKKAPSLPEQYQSVLQQLKYKPQTYPLELFMGATQSESAERRLHELNLDPAQPLIGLSPGSRWNTKRWPKERFVELGRQLRLEHNASILLLGGPDDSQLCELIAAYIGDQAYSLAGKLSLQESVHIVSKLKMLICNDSALMHMAAATQTPLVAIFGPTVKEFGYFPYQAQHQVVESDLACRPCTKNGQHRCPIQSHACMNSISTKQVLEATQKLQAI